MWNKCCSLVLVALLLCNSQAQILFNNKANQAAGDSPPTALSIVLQKLENVAIKAMNERGYSDLAEVTVAQNKPLGRWGKLVSSAAQSSMASGGNSLLTLDLPPAPLAELINVMELYQSLFGITPDFSNVNDTASFYQKVQDIILTSAPSFSLDCQPSFRVWPQEINAGFPDQHSVSHFMVMPAFGPNDLVMIEGTFPAARYFAYQTYDGNFSPVGFLRDAQIKPATGDRNSYAKGPQDDMNDAHGTKDVKYRIYLTKDGKRGFPNELGVAKSNFALGSLVVVVLRLYGVDPRANLTHPELAPWGFVPPVQVSTKIMGTFMPTATDVVWETYPQCPINNTLVVRDALTALTNLINMVDVSKKTCPSENVPDNFMYYQAQDPTPQGLGLGVVPPPPSRTPFPNQDASFLVACASNRPQYVRSSDMVVLARGYLPRTPGGLDDAPFVGDLLNYHVRYASFSVYDLNLPGPVLRSVSDDEFRTFYRKMYGNATWEFTYGRNVSLVVVKNRAVLDRCNLDTSDSFVVELDKHEPVTDWFGVVYREVLPQGLAVNTTPKAAALLASKKGMSVYDESIYDAKQVICGTGADEDICDPNPYRVAQAMKMHTPRIDYFLCSQSGVLHVAPPATPDPFAGKGYPPLADKSWNGDAMDDLVPEDVQTCINQTTGVAEGLVRAYSPCVQVHLHQTQRPVKVVPPGHVGVWDMPVATASTEVPSPVVVGLSVIAKTADEAPFLAEVELCGSTFVSDHHWRCSNEPPIDDTWLLPTFRETSDWKPATWARCASCVAGPAISAVKTPGTMRSKAAAQTLNATAVAAKKTTKKSHLKPKDQAPPLHFFSQDGRRYIQPSPRLDQEAEEAWREWQQAKDEANKAWRAWRLAKEQQQRNGTSTCNITTILPEDEQGILASSMASGGNGTSNINDHFFYGLEGPYERVRGGCNLEVVQASPYKGAWLLLPPGPAQPGGGGWARCYYRRT